MVWGVVVMSSVAAGAVEVARAVYSVYLVVVSLRYLVTTVLVSTMEVTDLVERSAE